MYVHVRLAQMYRGCSNIDLLQEWHSIFDSFMSAKHKWKIWQESCLTCEINSIFSVEYIEFCVYYILSTFWTFRHCMHFMTWSHNRLLFTQCANNSLWRYIFYSMKKHLVFLGWKCNKYGYLLYMTVFKNVIWFTGLGISCKGSEILWN